jgi:glutamyl-tRNA synthetase
MKERVSFIHEYITKSPYFFEAPLEYEETAKQKSWKPETPEQLKKLRDAFSLLNNPAKEDYEQTLKQLATDLDIGVGKLIHPLRLATSGMSTGPGVYDILHIIGKEEVLRRIDTAIEKLK